MKDPIIHRSLTPRPCPCLVLLSSLELQHLSRNCLRSGDGLADLAATLPGVQSALDGLGGLLDNLSTLGEDELNVGGVGHVGVDLCVVRAEKVRMECCYVHDREHGKCAFAAWEPG